MKKGATSGFLITCDPSREARCVKEVFNLLNDWVEKLYPELDILKIVGVQEKPEGAISERMDD